jgi:hypothetical protein
MNIARMLDGQIVGNWGQQDNRGLLQQLGESEGAGQART